MRKIAAIGLAGLGLLSLAVTPARADENGASLYLLGTGGPGAAILPPLEGVYFDNVLYIYDGDSDARKDFNLGGNVVADVEGTIVANFATLLWVPSTNVLGGTLAVGAALPYGVPIVDASVVLTGPRGRQLDVRLHDSAMLIGDPVATAELGWKSGKTHIALSGMLNVPVGNYRQGELANLAFHRWAGDVSAAVSWHDDETGWDVSGKAGVTFNGQNEDTHYDSGTDLHFEAAVEKTFPSKWTLGALGYFFQQVSDDEGSGAKLGPYRGRVAGLGLTTSYSTILGRSPATFRLNVMQEFAAENRLEGTAIMLSLALPLSMKLPPRPPS